MYTPYARTTARSKDRPLVGTTKLDRNLSWQGYHTWKRKTYHRHIDKEWDGHNTTNTTCYWYKRAKTGTNVQKLLYWYKRTKTDAAHLLIIHKSGLVDDDKQYSVCLLYWYKSTNTDAAHTHQAWQPSSLARTCR
jgi:hypothetical protein